MPERIALHRITIGEEDKANTRRSIMPGQRFNVSDAQAKELDAIIPPVCRDPRAQSADEPGADEDEGADAVRRVAQPERPANQVDTRVPAGAATDDPRVTRQPPAAPAKEDDL